MDEVSKEKLNRITSTDPEALTEGDKKFLRARRSYLNKTNKKKFEGVLKAKEVKPEVVKDPLEVSLKDLKMLARDYGIDEKGVSRAKIESSLRTKLGHNYKAEIKRLVDEKHNPNS